MRPTVTVTLALDPAAEPIAGVARDEQGTERPFTGWLGLAKALELALDGFTGPEPALHPAPGESPP
jgi:hypothetical protein